MGSNGGHPRLGVMSVLLLVSVGANLFFAGSLVGTWMRPALQPPGPGPRSLHAITRDLHGRVSPDAMAKLDGLATEIESRIHSANNDPRALIAELATLLAADTFDSDAFVQRVDRFIGDRAATDGAIGRRIAQIVAELPVADRRALAEVVTRPRPEHRFGPPPPP